MLWDVHLYQWDKGATYSDSERLISLSVGLDIVKDHPIFGVGAGNLRQEVKKFNGHLSANSLWKDEIVRYHFVTQRIYNSGKTNAEKQLNELLDFLSLQEIKLVKTVREFNIYDSNISLDSGWMS